MDIFLREWAKWKERIDKVEAARVGYKSAGIEYRIMVEGGVAVAEARMPFIWKQVVLDVDKAWRRARMTYPEHMDAIEAYFCHGETYRAVRDNCHFSQYKARKFVDEGRLIIMGALAAVTGFEDTDEN